MCVPLAAISLGTQIIGSMGQAQAANQQAAIQATSQYFNADMANILADQTMTQTQIESDKILARARDFQGKQIASTAASGMAVTSASSMALRDQTEARARSDAMATLYSGISKATQLRSGAGMATSGATNMLNATYVSPSAAILNGITKSLPQIASINFDSGINNIPNATAENSRIMPIQPVFGYTSGK